jgi:hypothetical protein
MKRGKSGNEQKGIIGRQDVFPCKAGHLVLKSSKTFAGFQQLANPTLLPPEAGSLNGTFQAVFLRILKPVENCRVALAGAAFHSEQI